MSGRSDRTLSPDISWAPQALPHRARSVDSYFHSTAPGHSTTEMVTTVQDERSHIIEGVMAIIIIIIVVVVVVVVVGLFVLFIS